MTRNGVRTCERPRQGTKSLPRYNVTTSGRTSDDIEVRESGNCGTTIRSRTAFRNIIFLDTLFGATDMEGVVILHVFTVLSNGLDEVRVESYRYESRGQDDNIECEFLACIREDERGRAYRRMPTFLCNDAVFDYAIDTIPIESHVRAMQRL